MAFTIDKSSLQMKLSVGTSEGKDVFKTKSYASLKTSTTDTLFNDFANLIADVQQYQSQSNRINTVGLN